MDVKTVQDEIDQLQGKLDVTQGKIETLSDERQKAYVAMGRLSKTKRGLIRQITELKQGMEKTRG